MRIAQEKVAAFMERIGDITNDKPVLIAQPEADRRAKFIIEEAEEYRDANAAGSLVEIADAIGDLLYVVLGAAVSHGIDVQPIFEEVHRSNMTKTPSQELVSKTILNQRSKEKRCTKGPDYQPPRLAELLILQKTGLDVVIR